MNRWTTDEIKLLKELYPVTSKQEILNKMNRSWASIENKARLLGISRKAKNKFFNEFYFDNIDTQEKAYWLGLIYSDGHVNQKYVCLSLKSDDGQHIINFAKDIKYKGSIYLNRDNNNYTSVEIRLSGEHITNIMQNRYCLKSGKTFTVKMPFDFISEDLLVHFIRGYFDGDGSISKRSNNSWRVAIIGNKEFLEELQNYIISKINISQTKIYRASRKRDDLFTFEIGGSFKTYLFLEWLYKNANRKLERKYLKYLQMKEEFEHLHRNYKGVKL